MYPDYILSDICIVCVCCALYLAFETKSDAVERLLCQRNDSI